MHSRIQNSFAQLEARHGIRILYACEAGSRAWGFPSPTSDYDVRFIYCHPAAWYLGLDEEADTLNFAVDELLDLGGWELRKTLKLLRGSNATLFEWLQSPIVYHEALDFRARLTPLLPRTFNHRAALHHYLGLVRRGLESDLTADSIRLKRLFYALRSALAARWIRTRPTVPPMEFGELREVLPPELRAEVEELLQRKARADEKTTGSVSAVLREFVQQEYTAASASRASLPVPRGPEPTAELNGLFRQWLQAAFPG
ncbi:nucleotidyltransferase domain-containing protein [Hymenobacter metallicola]|uniref:Nucleotidyltransferase domain-containing protein n=1 Tax=Hymenobacter metallicola TaxID=2563114 RepID=A0A4Z0QHT8_9BACT|nr:nucleotidyltransferase domain-containing protein [Hymenobacter metallicola]TGE28571.1 nucleotidyltransferase domain-containing protein [Hymenobacter metallicola]